MPPLARFQAKLANVASQIVPIVVLGDSITEGASVGGGSSSDTLSYNAILRRRLQAVYGGGGIGLFPQRSQAPTRYTVTGGGHSAGAMGPGSWSRRFATSGTNSISCAVNGDTGWIGYNETPNTGDFTYTIDGGAPVTVTCPSNGTTTARLISFSLGSNGAHTIVVLGSDVGGKQTDLWGVGASVGTTGIQVHQFGFSGQTAGYHTNGADALKYLTAIAPGLVICCLDTNDYAGQTAIATYEATLTTIITAAQAAGADVLFVTAPQRNSALAIPQSSYRSSIQTLCTTYDCTFVDLTTSWGTVAAQQSVIGLTTDNIHPLSVGHQQMADYIWPTFAGALPGTFQTEYAFNFRATAAYVTDGANEYRNAVDAAANIYPIYPLGGTSTTRIGNRVGWQTQGGVAISVGDRSAAVDARLAGIHFVAHGSAGTKRFNLEVSPGVYEIRLAAGDAAAAATQVYCQILDGATVLATLDNAGVGAGQFLDASGVIRTSAADWVTNNAKITVTVAGTLLTFDFGNPGGGRTGNNKIAHIAVKRLATPGVFARSSLILGGVA